MLVLGNMGRGPASRSADVHAIFGVGLIGASVCRHLRAECLYDQVELPFSWNRPALQSKELSDIEQRLILLARPDGDQYSSVSASRHIDILWSAGKCGFSSGEDETGLELSTFKGVLELAARLARRVPAVVIRFHLISSAGGLFEGSTAEGDESKPVPLRPYGVLKLEQEQLLGSLDQQIISKIYRLTSVYGYIAPQCRAGLVQTLLINGVRRRTSTIVGDLSTLRDYVFSEDIGLFVSGSMLALHDRASDCYLLSSGKASSICEVQRHIEGALGRKIYLNFVRNPTNSRDICLGWRAMPAGWSPVDLRTGIRAVHDHWRAEGYAWRE